MGTIKTLIACGLCLIFFVLQANALALPSNDTAPKTHTVEISGMKFQPAALTVKKGDKIVFINKDMVIHNVTGDALKSPDLATGKSWSMTATKSLNYFCSFHPVMKGKIVVK